MTVTNALGEQYWLVTPKDATLNDFSYYFKVIITFTGGGEQETATVFSLRVGCPIEAYGSIQYTPLAQEFYVTVSDTDTVILKTASVVATPYTNCILDSVIQVTSTDFTDNSPESLTSEPSLMPEKYSSCSTASSNNCFFIDLVPKSLFTIKLSVEFNVVGMSGTGARRTFGPI